jgi:gliding motility-associated-like protein
MDGAIPFSYRWSNDSTGINVSRLCTGTYTVTVTDGSNRTTTCTINLTQPARINIVVNQITPSSGSNGGATTTIGGGTPGYTFSWTNSQGSVVGSSKDLSNVAPGDYRLLVTDSKGCTQTVDVTVPMMSSGDTLRVSMAIDPRPGGGAISCRGACDGRIIATVSGSGAPFTYRWSHNANLNSNIANNLCPGTYRVTVTDATGRTATAGPLTIADAPDINLNVRRISCASDNSTSDARYEAVVSGGIAPYTYSWCSGAVAPTASDLAAGDCALTVTDNNGCTKTLRFTVCSESAADADCFKGILAISPNGDGANDNLVIQCVENFSNTLQIFNRWGQLVYQEVDYLNGWSGTDLDGTILTEGTYMWVLTVREPGKNDAIHKGTVTIVR